MPDLEIGLCTSFVKSEMKYQWKWGVLRGGTRAELVDGEYLAFFHSSNSART